MKQAEFQSRMCNIRCELEEIAQQLHDDWVAIEFDDLLEESLEDLSEQIKDLADAVAQYEDYEHRNFEK